MCLAVGWQYTAVTSSRCGTAWQLICGNVSGYYLHSQVDFTTPILFA
jgi:hypothetical protein